MSEGVDSLIVLPGLDGTGRWLSDFAAALPTALGCRIIQYPLDQPLGYEALLARVLAELPASGRYALLAESFSGPIGIRVAATRPPGLSALVLCGTFASNPFPYLRWARPLAVRAPLKSLPTWFRRLTMWGRTARHIPAGHERGLARVEPAVVRARIASIFAVDARADLQKIDVPVLVMRGTRDRVVSRRASGAMLPSLRNARGIDVEGPHLLLQSRPQQCAAAVLTFLHGAGRSNPVRFTQR